MKKILTGLMLLASIFLLFWDLNSFQFIVRQTKPENFIAPNKLLIADHPFWMVLGTLMLTTIFTMALLKINIALQLGTVFMEGLVAFVVFFAFRK